MTGRISLPVICLGILGFSILYVPDSNDCV
ncbi:MAG: hypothetical protein CM15mP46_3620 [Alphaproteobacteria bacterium]|nr:MAG: hypothetical protein CM15mP46_3620 [Alphaproteobacteria bacterium]